MRSVLVVFAHPHLESSRINRAMLQAAGTVPHVTVRDLYECYPDFYVDVAQEQALLRNHDVVVLQHPLFWYSCPALMKEWMDCVFEPGFAFGEGGIALRDKYLCNAVSTGASLEAYSEPGASLEQYLLPFRQTAAFCGMRYLQPFVVHAPHEMRNDDSEVKKTAQTYARALSFLTKANKFDICEFGGGQYLNQQINP